MDAVQLVDPVRACGLVPLPHNAKLQYSMYACSHTWQTWPSYICKQGKCDAAYCVVAKCGHIMELPKKKANKTWACDHHPSVCAHMPIHTSALCAGGKIPLFVCLGALGTKATTFAQSENKSFGYLKHTHANNKGVIQLLLCLCFLVQ